MKVRILPTGQLPASAEPTMKGPAMATDPYHLRLAVADERDRIQEIDDRLAP